MEKSVPTLQMTVLSKEVVDSILQGFSDIKMMLVRKGQETVLSKEVVDSILQGFSDIKMMLARKGQEEESSQWITSAEAQKMLGISQKTWQTYRDQRVIPFSQRGRKIYVRRADLEKYMKAHYVGGGAKKCPQ